MVGTSDGQDGSGVSIAAATKTEVRKTVVNATVLFAVIGAIASIMQIYQLINKDEPNLHGEVHLSDSFVPEGSRVSLSPAEAALWSYARNDAISKYCNKRTTDGRTNFYRDDENCSSIKAVTGKIEKSAKYGQLTLRRVLINVSNSGRDVAGFVKLRTPTQGHVSIFDQAEKQIVDKEVTSGDVLPLPNLNPGENIKIVVDSDIGTRASSYDNALPDIGYSKGKASLSTYRIVPPLFADIADAADGVPKALLILIFVVICFVVTVAVIMVAAVVAALLQGRPLSSIFKE